MLPNATLPDLGWYAMSMRGASSDVMNFPANLERFAESEARAWVSSELEWIQNELFSNFDTREFATHVDSPLHLALLV